MNDVAFPLPPMQHFILDGHNVVPAGLYEWAAWLEAADRIVKQEEVRGHWVSTVFIGVASDELFETMVFSNRTEYKDIWCEHTSTWDEAEKAHAKAVALCKEGQL